jgi:hypothetical protein
VKVRVGVDVGVLVGVGVKVTQLPMAHAALKTGPHPGPH